MKKILLVFTTLICVQLSAQNSWFTAYSDSTSLVEDANKIICQFMTNVQKINPSVEFSKNEAIKNTTPYLIFINNATISIPFWAEVIPQQKDFFTEIAGGVAEGEEVFGLFFNGFYLAHELGHSISESLGKSFDNNYDSEFDANKIGVLYWRAVGEESKLKECYTYAKKILKGLKNPVPENENYKEYITKHYHELALFPDKYGYIQFSQFVEIFEDRSLPDFEDFIKEYNK